MIKVLSVSTAHPPHRVEPRRQIHHPDLAHSWVGGSLLSYPRFL
jgi:hypothetical protein